MSQDNVNENPDGYGPQVYIAPGETPDPPPADTTETKNVQEEEQDNVEYEEYDDSNDSGGGFSLLSFTPMGFLLGQAKCFAISIIVFMILMWLISLIPFVGPWISRTIKLVITKVAVFAGVLNCGFQDGFVQEVHKSR